MYANLAANGMFMRVIDCGPTVPSPSARIPVNVSTYALSGNVDISSRALTLDLIVRTLAWTLSCGLISDYYINLRVDGKRVAKEYAIFTKDVGAMLGD